MRVNEKGVVGVIVTMIILGVLIAPFLIYRSAKYGSIHTETFTVTELPDRTFQKNADGSANQYANLVYTDQGVFSNVDSTFPWKKNSSDIRNQLQEDKTYTCEVSGWRVGWLSRYKNITRCAGMKKY